ncbi:MAG: hypothetical protein KF778_07375 [Rhodocyclaceae bacterium]|nr:hypothetical protein [Rhodocyclaceae bacterium]MBX3668211.1 hypothetical protein [Rhodocyclaceae bacterium]
MSSKSKTSAPAADAVEHAALPENTTPAQPIAGDGAENGATAVAQTADGVAKSPARAGKTAARKSPRTKPPESAQSVDVHEVPETTTLAADIKREAKAARKAAKKAGRTVECRLKLTRAQLESLGRIKGTCSDAGLKLRKGDVMAWAIKQLDMLDAAQLVTALTPPSSK